MSFRCEVCKVAQEPGTKEIKVVTAIRKVEYPAVKKRDGRVDFPKGYETVKELVVCPECAKKSFAIATVGEKVLV